jgi:hypothetical protein
MLKYKQNRKLTEFVCDFCKSIATKPTTELTRNYKLNRKNFCSKVCSLKYGHLVRPNTSRSNRYDISKHSGNREDLFTPYKYTFNTCKRRYKEFSITMEDLKDQWELQKGTCPYSKMLLELPVYNKKTHPSIRASLDRIDSSKGYIKGNIQFVSTLINFMKSNLSHYETLDFIDNLVKNYNSCYQEDQTISSPDLGAGR